MHKYLLISPIILSIFLFGCGDRSSSPNPMLLADGVTTQPLSELKKDVNVMLLVFGEENVSVNNDGDDRIEIPINALTKRVIEESIREAVKIKAITNRVIKTLKKKYTFNKNKTMGAITSESFVKTVLEEIPDSAVLKNVDTEALAELVDEIMAGKTPVEKPVPEPEETQETSEEDQQKEVEEDQQKEVEEDQQKEAEDDQQQEAVGAVPEGTPKSQETQGTSGDDDQTQEGVDAVPEGTPEPEDTQGASGNNQVQPNANTQSEPQPQPETQEDTDTDTDTDTQQQVPQDQVVQGAQGQQQQGDPNQNQQQQGTQNQQQQVNNAPVFSDGSSTTRAIAENTGSGENIGFPVSATDADNDTLTYTLGGTDASAFSIVSSSGQLQTSAALDYETKSAYALTVSVSDGNGGSDSITVTISVTDVDETQGDPPPGGIIIVQDPPFVPPEPSDPPPSSPQQQANNAPVFSDGSSTTREIAENTGSGENIGSPVSATDADGDTLTYTLGGTNASSFSIVSSSGQLRTSAALDYETKSAYALTVSVSDGKGGSSNIAVTIDITDVNENRAPVFTEGTSTTREIAENTVSGVNIGSAVSATDADGDTLTYSLGGTDASAFSIVSSSGQLQTSAALDYETKSAYALTVSVSDGNGGSDSITVTISVTDVDETPNDPPPQVTVIVQPPQGDPIQQQQANNAPVFSDGTSTTRAIAENTFSNIDIGSPVSATDADGDTLTYTLGGTDASAFSIVSSSGQLQTSAALNYEVKNSYTVTVSVSDGKGGTNSITVTINVTDVDEPQGDPPGGIIIVGDPSDPPPSSPQVQGQQGSKPSLPDPIEVGDTGSSAATVSHNPRNSPPLPTTASEVAEVASKDNLYHIEFDISVNIDGWVLQSEKKARYNHVRFEPVAIWFDKFIVIPPRHSDVVGEGLYTVFTYLAVNYLHNDIVPIGNVMPVMFKKDLGNGHAAIMDVTSMEIKITGSSDNPDTLTYTVESITLGGDDGDGNIRYEE